MYERVFATSCLHSRCVLPFARWLWISAYEILIGGLCDCAYAYAAPVTCDAPAATCASMCARLSASACSASASPLSVSVSVILVLVLALHTSFIIHTYM